MLMGQKYDEFMVSEFDTLDVHRGDFDTAKRRLLIAKWADEVYIQLEAEREAAERAQERDPVNNPGSLFYRAFLSTGCMVDCDLDADGKNDRAQIRPHRSINDDPALLNKLHANILPPTSMEGTLHELDEEEAKKWVFQIDEDGHVAESDEEDIDDEPPEGDSCVCEKKCTCEKEPLPDDVCECEDECKCNAEWEFVVPENERDLIKKAAAAVVDEELRDWGLARRLTMQMGLREDTFMEVEVAEGKRKRRTRVPVNQPVLKSRQKKKQRGSPSTKQGKGRVEAKSRKTKKKGNSGKDIA